MGKALETYLHQKAKDSEDSEKLRKANLALRDFVLRLGSDSESIKND